MKLDIGCGNFPTGDVNTDLFIEDIGHRTGTAKHLAPSLAAQKIKNFVLCDAGALPFREDVFDEVYSSHTIEHVNDPSLMIKEMVRVSKDKISIVCPHRYGAKMFNRSAFHKSYLSKKWFFKIAKKLSVVMKINYSKFVEYPLLSFLPLEMSVDMRKQTKL